MCTTFLSENKENIILGKNLDMFTNLGYIFTNQKGIKKVALIQPPEKPADWIARYGSITFNQAGKEFPNGGINEKGLVVEQMTLPGTKYPAADIRSEINELQWIQYMLDTCATVNEVIKQVENIRISENSFSSLHYYIADCSGKSAVIEYLEGEMLIYYEAALPVTALTNSTYKDSLEFYYNNICKDRGDFYLTNSLDRFKRVADRVKAGSKTNKITVEGGFKILKEAKRSDTAWSIIYDLESLTIYFKTQHYPDIKIINLKDINFSNEYSLYLNMNIEGKGNVLNKMRKYSKEINKELISSLYRNKIFMEALNINFSDEMIDLLAGYPDQ